MHRAACRSGRMASESTSHVSVSGVKTALAAYAWQAISRAVQRGPGAPQRGRVPAGRVWRACCAEQPRPGLMGVCIRHCQWHWLPAALHPVLVRDHGSATAAGLSEFVLVTPSAGMCGRWRVWAMACVDDGVCGRCWCASASFTICARRYRCVGP